MYKQYKFNKYLILIPVAIVIIILFVISFIFRNGFNKQVFDLQYSYNKAYVLIDGEWEKFNIDSWTDYADGDQLQVTTTDGEIYLSSSNNIVLVKE